MRDFSSSAALERHIRMELKAKKTLEGDATFRYVITLRDLILRKELEFRRATPKLGFLVASLYWHFVDVV